MGILEEREVIRQTLNFGQEIDMLLRPYLE